MPDHFAAISEERHRVADFLEALTDDQWDTPSCCGDWTIEGVAAHMLVGPVMGMRGAMPYMFKARMNPAKAGVLTAQAMPEKFDRDGLVGAMREYADSRFTPPGFDSAAPLVDITIHGQDMSRPLGVDLGVPVERWLPSLETATASRYGISSARKHLLGAMTETTPIANDELRISVEAGDEYHAPPRVAAALRELASALEEEDGDDVAGFGGSMFSSGFSLFYVGTTDIAYTENDAKGKKKGNVEYSWHIEEGEK